jgi:ectoine hydroxylase
VPETGDLQRAVDEAVDSVEKLGYAVLDPVEPAMLATLQAAADEMAARWADDAPGGQLHLLSALEQHPTFLSVIDWPPLLGSILALLSANIYIHHSHFDVHPPHEPTDGRRWHRDGGVQGRDMRRMPGDQPRMSVKAGIFLSDVEHADEGAFELVPRSHFDLVSRPPAEDPAEAVAMVVPAGSVVLFDARVWHRRRDNLGTATRKAIFMAYTYRWVTSRDCRFVDVPEWQQLTGVRRQLLGDPTWDPFYLAPGELPLDQLARTSTSA